MKIVIDDTLTRILVDELKDDPKDAEDDVDSTWEEYQFYWKPMLDKCSVRHTFSRDDATECFRFKIHPQKISLHEKLCNHLFSEVLQFFDFRMEYANFGGEGCDFSVRISPLNA